MNCAHRQGRGWVVIGLGLLLTLTAAPLAAQSNSQEEDPFAEMFFDPELVMQNRQRIGLTDAQWEEISGSLRELQRQAVDYEWDMAEVATEFMALISVDQIDEAAAVEAARRIFEVENEIKVIQMQMLVRIKNVLTPQQQSQLRDIRGGM